MKTRILTTLALGAIVAVSAAGCSSGSAEPGGDDAPSASSAPSTPTTAADSKEELKAKLLTLDEVPTGGWAIKPEQSSESPETSTDKGTDDICAGDLTSVVDLDPDSAATITFERRGAEFSDSVSPAKDPEQVVAQIEAAVTPCFGNPQETTVSGQKARFEFIPLATTGIDGTAMGYTLSFTINYVTRELPFIIVAGDGVVIATSITPATGEYVTPEEFVELTQAAVKAAS